MVPEGKIVPCILCGGFGSRALKKFLLRGQRLVLRRCNKDRLVYLSPRLEEIAQRAVYESDSLSNSGYYSSTFDEDAKTFMQRLELARRFGNPKSALDVGSSVGTFLHCCAQKGIKKLAGVELNSASRDYARKRFGISTSAAMPKSGKFDLVNLSDIIEHMQNPVEELKKLRKHMRKTSTLLISTPDYDNLIARLIQVKPEEHLYYFTKRTLRQALRMAGFRVLYMRNTSRTNTVKNLLGSTLPKKAHLLAVLRIILLLRIEKVVEAAFINRANTDILALAQPLKRVK